MNHVDTYQQYHELPRDLSVIPNKKMACDLYAIILVILEENIKITVLKIV